MTVDLEKLKQMESTTDRADRKRCPECEQVKIRQITNPTQTYRDVARGEWFCETCEDTFEQPITGKTGE